MNKISVGFNGRMILLNYRDEADISVLREIFKIREYRVAEDPISKAQSCVVDVGAHAGYFSLYCYALNPKVKIYAIEPEKNNLEIMETNLKNNKVKNVTVVSAALGIVSGRGKLELSADNHNHRLSGRGTEVVRVVSWKDFCKKNEIDQVDLLKMDIEGGEYDVLRSFDADDFGKVKSVIMEYHNGGGQNGKEIEMILRENGFGVQVFPSKFDKHMGIIFASNKRSI